MRLSNAVPLLGIGALIEMILPSLFTNIYRGILRKSYSFLNNSFVSGEAYK